MSAIGCRIVVSDGHTVEAIEVSSKPTMDRSLGTFRAMLCATMSAAAAMSSFAAKMAVGRWGLLSRAAAASRPVR